MEKIWVSRYELESIGSLNAKSDRRLIEGALVRIGSGFGCVHPWPELGDPTLEECLADLAGTGRFPLVQKTLACIEADGRAREEGRSLFDGVEVPVSHATLPFLSDETVEKAAARGFTHIKTKAGRNLWGEMNLIQEMIRRWPDLRWRIDFNGAAEFAGLVEIFETWKVEDLGKVDFLEDPFVYQASRWREFRNTVGLPLANDRGQKDDDGKSEVLVLKPAVDSLSSGEQRRVVTSYMDHPFGQCYAAWEAGRLGIGEICGLQTHGLFKPNSFTEILGAPGPGFLVPEGTGLGFEDLLEALEWIC